MLKTHIQMDTTGSDLFKRYTNSCEDTIDSTFNLKDFAVIVQFCKSVQADVLLRLGAAGTPLLAEAVWENETANDAAEHVQAELLLATISESVQVRCGQLDAPNRPHRAELACAAQLPFTPSTSVARVCCPLFIVRPSTETNTTAVKPRS